MKCYSKYFATCLFICIGILPGWILAAPIYTGTEIVISRSENKLFVMKNGITLRQYHVAFGMGGMKAKRQEGDRKTPIGNYQIIKIKENSRFHRFIQLNYPAIEDAKRALGTHLISQSEYQGIVNAHRLHRLPPQNTALGGAIGIHGIGDETQDKIDIHNNIDWTKGCIAMRNKEIDELLSYISSGTKVIIRD